MKEPAAYSPFAAMTPQEQRHRWTVWQAQQQMPAKPITSTIATEQDELEKNRPDAKQTDVCSLASELPKRDPLPVQQQMPPLRAAIRHSQYDAVVKRMKQASMKACQFTSVPGAASTTQPSSGKE